MSLKIIVADRNTDFDAWLTIYRDAAQNNQAIESLV
jgi:hypothetical protein